MNNLLRQTFMTFLSGLIVVNSCYADPNSTVLTKGEMAPFSGILLSNSYAIEVMKELNDYDHLKLINESLEKSISLYEDNEKVYLQEIVEIKDQNMKLDTALQKANTNSFWVKAMWFAIGMVVTGSAVYVANKSH